MMRWINISRVCNFIIRICTKIQLVFCGIWLGTTSPFIDSDAHGDCGYMNNVCNKGKLLSSPVSWDIYTVWQLWATLWLYCQGSCLIHSVYLGLCHSACSHSSFCGSPSSLSTRAQSKMNCGHSGLLLPGPQCWTHSLFFVTKFYILFLRTHSYLLFQIRDEVHFTGNVHLTS